MQMREEVLIVIVWVAGFIYYHSFDHEFQIITIKSLYLFVAQLKVKVQFPCRMENDNGTSLQQLKPSID